MPDDPRGNLDMVRRQAAATGAELARHQGALAMAQAELASLGAQIAAAGARNDQRALAMLGGRQATLVGTLQQAVRDLTDSQSRLRDWLDKLQAFDPCDCGVESPLLLLPVRLETRFETGSDSRGGKLRIRIFPDQVHIDALRRRLSAEEKAFGEAYWQAIWAGGAPAGPWSALRAAVGPTRAAWVAEAARPTNAATAPGGSPVFPTQNETAARSVVARLLPDRFVAVARQRGREYRATGATIAGDPEMGIFLPDETAEDLVTVGGVTVSKESAWIVDYAAAEAKGLAIGLDLPANSRVDDLFVFGVRRSLDATQTVAALEAQLRAHRYSTGLGFVAQGTPTNNLDDARAGWTAQADDQPPTLVGNGPAGGARLAAALGIAADVFAGVPGVADQEDAVAKAANHMLWETSWGSFLDAVEKRDDQGRVSHVSELDRESARRLHRGLVRGRGPLPAIRVGKQPYGVLPVGNLTGKWVETDPFFAKLMPLVANARKLWRDQVKTLPRIVPGDGSSDETLLAILGMSAVSLGVRARETFGTDMGKAFGIVTGDIDTEDELTTLLANLMAPLPEGLVYVQPVAALGESRPIALPYVHDSDPDQLRALIASGHIQIRSVLQALAQLAWSRTRERSDRIGPADLVSTAISGIRGIDQTVASRANDFAGDPDRVSAGRLLAIADELAGSAPETMSLLDYQPEPGQLTSFTRLAGASTTLEGRAELGRAAAYEWFIGRATRKQMVEALTLLADTPSNARRIALAEAIDVASHRLDAWITAIVQSRVAAKRASTPAGLHIGAFGWVQGIDPGQKDDRNAYIHAPSLAQAATAGVLRSAYLAHNAPGDPQADGAFAIDLTSARVRDAMDLLDAVREGQGLATALGYRIERGLHEAGLDRYVLNLRALAPLSAGRLIDHGSPPPPDVAAHLARANVVDGVALIEKAKSAGTVSAAMAKAPEDNPYITGPWIVGPSDVAGVQAIIDRAAGSLDAVSDLLTAEAVHNLVQGSIPRAVAAIDAAGTGDSPAPIPTVVATPAAAQQVTHRVLLLVGGGAGWHGGTQPRALAEPMLEAWAAARLGPPQLIVAALVNGQERSLAGTGLAALDLVYLAADPKFLAGEIRRRLQLAPDASLLDRAGAGWPRDKRALGDVIATAAALRTVLASATPANAGDLGVPFGDAEQAHNAGTGNDAARTRRAISSTALEQAFQRVEQSRATLALRAQALTPGLDPASRTATLSAIADFGIIPPAGGGDTVIALARDEALQRVAECAKIQAAPHSPASLARAAACLFGDGFVMLPTFAPVAGVPADEFDAALATQAAIAPPSAVRRWLADSGSVRGQVARYADTLLLADALGITPALGALQLAGAGSVPPAAWIGLGPADGVVASYVVERLNWTDPEQPVAALVLDQFVEALPGSHTLTSGLAFNAPSPNARPPQAWLLAVAPNDARWTTETVLATLRETLDLAKLRGVALENQPPVARALPALYQQSWSLQGEEIVDFSVFTGTLAVDNPMRFIKET